MKALEFSDRYPVEEEFSLLHVGSGIGFDPAVWMSVEFQKFLIDMISHSAHVRDNSWSSCRQMLYAIRHHNVRQFGYDILKGKARLWQILDGLKKLKGPRKANVQ